jgi:broad specificity phosphatase PhoE
MAATLVFIRHAETDLAGTFCGRTDPPLNAAGQAQLGPLQANLAAVPCTAIHTSDLLRARQTAEAVGAARQLPVYLSRGLREIDFGDWETLSWEQIEQRDPAYAARWVAEFPNLPAPNGEPIPVFKHRVLTEISRLRQLNQDLAIVTHAGPLRVLLEELGHFAPHHAWERTRDYTCTIRCTQQSPTGHLEIHP